MQKKFVIIDNDRLLNDLVVEQMSIVFENFFNIKFFKSYCTNVINELDTIDLTIVNFKFIKDNFNVLTELENKKKSKIIIVFDDRVDRSQLKKYSNYNFVVKPFKLNQLIDIIKDYFITYETRQKNIKITNNLIFRPETKILLNKKNNIIVNLTEKESLLLNFILENKKHVLKKLDIKDLDRGPRGNFSCKFYERIIHNTDLMSEQQIVELISHEAVKSPRRYTVRRE